MQRIQPFIADEAKNLKSLANSLCVVHAEIHSYEEGFTCLIDCSASHDAAGSYTDLQREEEEDDALFVTHTCSNVQ